MNKILDELNNNYLDRCSNFTLQQESWLQLSNIYEPDLNKDLERRISIDLARISGDIGVSMLWIVQATLVRSLSRGIINTFKENSDSYNLLSKINNNSIGALAQTEDINNPLIIQNKGDTIVLNGTKRYITGGNTCSFILLTAKEKGEDKVSKLVYISTELLPEGVMQELDLKSLRTTSHGILTLENFEMDKKYLLDIDASSIRRNIKKWSLIERSLIMESYIAFLQYLSERINILSHELNNDLSTLLKEQCTITNENIHAVNNNGRIELNKDIFKPLGTIISTINQEFTKNMDSLPQELQYRYQDMMFMVSLQK